MFAKLGKGFISVIMGIYSFLVQPGSLGKVDKYFIKLFVTRQILTVEIANGRGRNPVKKDSYKIFFPYTRPACKTIGQV